MNEHDTNILLFTLLTEAQGTLNRALSHHFQQSGSIDKRLFQLHGEVWKLADEYRRKIVGNKTEPTTVRPDQQDKISKEVL